MMKFTLVHIFIALIIASSSVSSASNSKNRSNSTFFSDTGCKLFPDDSVWNTPIDTLPVHALSAIYINSIDAFIPNRSVTLHPDFGYRWRGLNLGIPYTIVPSDQAMVPIFFDGAWDESDMGDTTSCATRDHQQIGCYPIPDNVDIEGGTDNHILVIQKGSCLLYEVHDTRGGPGKWSGYSGAIWDLSKNQVRPKGVTSADAAGLPILPGLIRYDEIYTDKAINHVIRVTLEQIQSAYLWPPSTHTDGTGKISRNLPPMGLQLRLKANYDISEFDPNIQVILIAMKKFGLIVADTGGQMYVSGAHDSRWDSDLLRQIAKVKITDFEVVETGATLIDY